jgi:hypothetical protein
MEPVSNQEENVLSLHVHRIPHSLNFCVGSHWTHFLSLTISHGYLTHRVSGRMSKVSLAIRVPCFQGYRESQSQTIGALSRLCFAIALWDKESNKMFFFTKANLSHWSNHYFTNPDTGFKDCRMCGLILQLELPVCCQSHLSYLVMESLASPPPPGKLQTRLEQFNVFWVLFFCCQDFSVLFCPC